MRRLLGVLGLPITRGDGLESKLKCTSSNCDASGVGRLASTFEHPAWRTTRERDSGGPGGSDRARVLRAVEMLVRMNAEIDIRPVLSTIRVPTLLLHSHQRSIH